jgi:hypothetical protein
MMTIRRALAAVTFATLVGASAGCTVLLNHDAAQCQTDSDCAHFGDHPYCQNNVCVSSGLGPSACFYGSPAAPQDFMNQCSLAACLPFDNCSRMGLCGATAGAGPSLVAPTLGDASTSSSPVVADGGVALPSCMDPANGRAQVVFMTGSSNFPPLLAKLAPLVLATGYTPIYQVTSSCTGVSAVFGPATIHDPAPGPSAKYAAFFAQDGTSTPCTLGPEGANVDVGESDIFSTTCDANAVAGSTVGEYLGPIQAMAFVVPGKSQEQAISAEAARAVFGTGGDDGKATP